MTDVVRVIGSASVIKERDIEVRWEQKRMIVTCETERGALR